MTAKPKPQAMSEWQSRVIQSASRFWSPLYDEWRSTVAASWETWIGEFTRQPDLPEIEAAFRRLSEAGAKRPPSWEEFRRSIFEARKISKGGTIHRGIHCDACGSTGFLLIFRGVHRDGTREVLNPYCPRPIAAAAIHQTMVPCACPIGEHHEAKAADQGHQTMDRATRERLLAHRFGDDVREHYAYMDRCQALFEALPPLPPRSYGADGEDRA